MLVIIIFIIGLVVSTMIVNKTQQLLMKWLDLSAMFINPKTKAIVIVVVALILSAIVIQLFGIRIPR